MEEFLIETGFHKSVNSDHYYVLRIHAEIWLAYDLSDGFVELRREVENRKRDRIMKIILPKPFRDKNKLKKLLELLT